MVEQITSKNTKAEILEAYNTLFGKNRELRGKIEELRGEKKTALTQEPQVREAKPLAEVVTGATIDDTIQGLGYLQAGFGSAISELSLQLTAEATKLEELRQVIEARTRELKELHGLEVMEHTLDELIQKYIEKSQSFEEEMNQKRQTFEQKMAEKQKAWQDEREEHARFIEEQDESLKKARQREVAEYQYELEHTRKQDVDDYEQNRKKLNEVLDEFAQQKRKEWQEREKTIAEQEKLLAREAA